MITSKIEMRESSLSVVFDLHLEGSTHLSIGPMVKCRLGQLHDELFLKLRHSQILIVTHLVIDTSSNICVQVELEK